MAPPIIESALLRFGLKRRRICHDKLAKKPLRGVKEPIRVADGGIDSGTERTHRMDSEGDTLRSVDFDEFATEKGPNHDRALAFVELVLELHRDLVDSPDGCEEISPVAIDVEDMVRQAEKFLDCQDAFRRRGCPVTVTLAYHYTKEEFMESIAQEGLMTSKERSRRSRGPDKSHGDTYGDGVYTAANPFAFHSYSGGVGVLVAILVGNSRRVNGYSRNFDKSQVNTVIGNQRHFVSSKLLAQEGVTCDDFPPDEKKALFDELVLLQSSQCLPLIRYCSNLISKADDYAPGNKAVWMYHQELQRLIDDFFNDGIETKLNRVLPSSLFKK